MNIVKDTDKGYKNLLKLMKQEKINADIGIFHNAGMSKGTTIAEYATYNEYGATIKSLKARMWLRHAMNRVGLSELGISKQSFVKDGQTINPVFSKLTPVGNIVIPERSFMRSTFDEQEKNAFNIMGQNLRMNILKPGFSIRKVVATGAEYMRSEIIKKIKTANQWAKPNRPFTIAMKGKDQPLIHKGIMWKSVVWKINKIGE